MFDRIANGQIVESSDLKGSWVGPELAPNADNTGYAGVAPAGQDGKIPQVTYSSLYLWPAADLALLGWFARADQPPAFDATTQVLAATGVAIVNGKPVQQYAVTAIPLGNLKAKRSADVDALLLAKSTAGVAVSGAVAPVQMRDGDRANLDGQALRAGLAKQGIVVWDPTTAWRLADNSNFAIATADAMIAFADGAGGAYLALRKRAWFHKDAITALADPAAIVAYDITTGW